MIGLVALVAALPAAAQVKPEPGAGDPRIQSVEYKADQIVLLQAAAGFQLSVEFAPDERIESVAVGDSGGWQVTANRNGDRLFIKPEQTSTNTNLTVVTDARTYLFDLTPLIVPSADMAYSVRFRYPQATPAQDAAPTTAISAARYLLSGRRALRPSAMSDDGVHTYLEWPSNVALPAVYAVGEKGMETLVNGMMRDGIYVIDGIFSRFSFRIDKRKAGAVRKLPPADR